MIFFDYQSVLQIKFLSESQTVNKDYYLIVSMRKYVKSLAKYLRGSRRLSHHINAPT